MFRNIIRKNNLNLGNVAANIVARMSSICLNIAAVPLLVEYLGFEAYGVIGFYNVVIAVVALLEVGLPLAINRAVAQFSSSDDDGVEISKVIKSFEFILGSMAILIALAWMLCSQFISESWLVSETNNSLDIVGAVFLIGILVGFRFPIGLYTSVLGGLQKQVIMNLLIIIFSWLRICIPLLAVAMLDFSLVEFLELQIWVSAAELIIFRNVAWSSHCKFDRKASFSIALVVREGKLAISIGAMAAIAVIIGQLDKIMVSGLIELEMFGFYTIAAMFGLALITLGYPFSSAVFPQFSQAFQNSDNEKIRQLFHSYMSIFIPCLFALSAPLLMYTSDILNLYLLGETVTDTQVKLTQLFVTGGVFAGILSLPNSLIIASGNLNALIRYNLGTLLTYPVILYWLIAQFGAVGAALSFSVYQGVSCFAIILISNRLSRISKLYLIFGRYFLLPTLVCFCVTVFISSIFSRVEFSIVVEIALYVILIFTILIAVMFVNRSKDVLTKA